MKKENYTTQVFALCKSKNTHNSFELWIFDPEDCHFRKRFFDLNDIYCMKEAGISALIEMCNYALQSFYQPWWNHAWYIREHLGFKYNQVLPPLSKTNEEQREKLWEAVVWFAQRIYVSEQYKKQQALLWNNIRKDFLFSRKFFKHSSQLYNEFLIRYIAAFIGDSCLDNAVGD